MSLWSDFLNNRDRVIHKLPHYFPIYEKHFSPWVNKSLLFFEIGVYRGGSLQMWKKYFGPHVRIVGIDIKPKCKRYEEEQVSVRIGDQSDHKFLSELIEEFGPPDIVLDDGSHQMEHITSTFEYLYPRLSKNGVYLVEDLCTAYWEEYGGGLGQESSFIEKCKHLVDKLNTEHTRGLLQEDEFSQSTLSMHFYNSIVAFEKGHPAAFDAQKHGKEAGIQGLWS
jgi:23S rRNA U2552 (ribose-2'-O)-methylase RlmE/FtsJ